MEQQKLLAIINEVRGSQKTPLTELKPNLHLRKDLQMDSLQLAELTVRIEDETGIDLFADGIVNTVGEIEDLLTQSQP